MFEQKEYEDKLREITSIGTGHLATKLSNMIHWKVEISRPAVWAEKSKSVEDILPFKTRMKLRLRGGYEIRNTFDVGEENVYSGEVVQVIEKVASKNLVRLIFNRDIEQLDDIDKRGLLRAMNELAATMVGAVGTLIGETVKTRPGTMKESNLYRAIKDSLEGQRKRIGWTYFSTVNIMVRGKEGFSFLLILLPYFDMAKVLSQ